MKKIKIIFLVLSFLLLSFSPAMAAPLIYDWAFNIDGNMYGYYEDNDTIPVSGNVDDFDVDDYGNGLGTLTYTFSVAGDHSFIAFFDHEADRDTNTYFNESGEAVNTPVDGQSWEIDEPGWFNGDIYLNVNAGALDNSIGSYYYSDDEFGVTIFPNDVSMAIGWDFELYAGETATITLLLSSSVPNAGFYLYQYDSDSGASIYFSSILDIREGGDPGNPVPEPATMMLLGSGLAGLFGFRRFRKR